MRGPAWIMICETVPHHGSATRIPGHVAGRPGSRSSSINEPGADFSGKGASISRKKEKEAKRKKRFGTGRPVETDATVGILKNRISTVACKTLRVSHSYPQGPAAISINNQYRGGSILLDQGGSVLHCQKEPWRALWDYVAARIHDDEHNQNNRFTVAAAMNEATSGTALGMPNKSSRSVPHHHPR